MQFKLVLVVQKSCWTIPAVFILYETCLPRQFCGHIMSQTIHVVSRTLFNFNFTIIQPCTLHLSSSLHVFCVNFSINFSLIFHCFLHFPSYSQCNHWCCFYLTLLHARLPGIDDVREHAFVSSMVCILCFMKICLLLYKTLLSKIVLG
jgi:hypothetical protein